MNKKKTNGGFTLIEMLIALAIILIIVTMVYGSYAATTRSMDVCGTRMDCSERASLVLRLMARQIRGAYVPVPDANAAASPEVPAGAIQTLSDSSGGGARTFVQAEQAWFRGDSDAARGRLLSFVTTSGPGAGPDVPRSLGRVGYLYDRSSATLSMRRQDCVDPIGNPEDAGTIQPILSKVAKISLAFYDGERWQDEWDYDKQQELPRAVKIELVLKDKMDRERHYETTAPVFCQIHTDRTNSRTKAVPQ